MGKPIDCDVMAFEFSETNPNLLIIRFKDRMSVDNAAEMLQGIRMMLKTKHPSWVTVDLKDVTYFDDYGALVLSEIRRRVQFQKGEFQIINASSAVQEMLALVDFNLDETKNKPKRAVNILIRLGQSTIQEVKSVGFMVRFLGEVIFCWLHMFYHPRSLRKEDTLTQMEKTGVNALPVVALISFLLGLIMAFMSSIQFRQFGAGIYVASLVAFAMVSELGPIMTAIVVAGRSGSAYAAEIAAMKINEEVDALMTMGFNPVLFLTVPRMLAALIVVPILTIFSDLFAIAGGLIVGITMLDLTPNSYMKQTVAALSIFEVVWGVTKSAVFALLISWVGCLRGFQARGGASAVGNAATSAVVTSIFLIILFDSIFAVIRSYWK